jgi:hypothetical protein
MSSYDAGYAVGFVIGLAIALSVVLVIGAAVLKLACHLCGEGGVGFPHALGIVFVNGLVQAGINAVVRYGIMPQVGSGSNLIIGFGLALIVSMLAGVSIISAMVPTSFPKAIAIWLMQFVVVAGFVAVIMFLAGRAFSPVVPGTPSPGASPAPSAAPSTTGFLTEALHDLKSLEGTDPDGKALASRAGSASPAPSPRGPAIGPPPAASEGAGGFSGSRFTRPDAGTPAASRTPRPGAGAQGSFTPQILLWQVKVDPPAEAVAIPADKALRIPIPANFFKGNDVLFPAQASPFVAVGKNRGDDNLREVWDLRTGKRVGRLAGKIDLEEKAMALSPDGQLLAGKVDFKDTVGVLSIATKRPVAQVELGRGTPDVFDFLGPDRLVVGSSREKVLEVWDIKAGRKLHEIPTPTPFDPRSPAISPGSHYLAVASKDDSMLRVYDLQTGQVAGEETLPKDGAFGQDAQGMAFSPDGAELAAVFESFGKVRILCWKVADGSVAADTGFDDKGGIKRQFGYEGPAIQWIPGLDAWLVFGEAVIDRTTGQKVYAFPFDRQNYQPGPRRPLDAGRMLVVFGDRSRTVISAEIPEQVVKALEIARAGGNAVDALLPPLTTADLSKARRVPAASGAVPWSVAPDPTPAGKAFVSRPIALRSQNGEPRRILFSDPDAAVVLVSNQAGGPFNSQEDQPRWLDRYDLTGGKHLGRLDLPPVSEPIAVSPDGTLALTVDAKERDRLDVWSLTGKTPVAGWRPYDKEAGEDRAVTWAAFLDARHVLTVNTAGRLILWGVPGCQAVYMAETGGRGTAALSPGRKWLALGTGAAVRFLDPMTGEARGEAAPSSAQRDLEMKAAAFSTDGGELLTLLNETLVRWDLATGRAVAEFRSPVGAGTQLEWCGPRHALLDNQKLIELDTQRHIWSYFGPTAATGGPDGLHWFAAPIVPNPAPVLAAVRLPSPEVDRVLAMAADPKVPALLRTGGKVGLQLDLNGPPKDPEGYRKALTDQIATRLQAVGVAVADGQPVRLVVSVQEGDTGETVELRKMFPRMGENPFATRTLAIKKLEYQLSIADPQGSFPLVPKQTLIMPTFGIVHTPAGEDTETYLRGRMWDSAKALVGGSGVPYFLARGPEGPITLPGTTNLNQPPR